MKRYRFARVLLQAVADLWLVLSIISALITVSFVFTKRDKYETSTSKTSTIGIANPLANGFPMKADLRATMPADTLIEYKGKDVSGGFILPQQSKGGDSLLKAVLADTSIKEYTYTRWVVQPSVHSEYIHESYTYRSDIFDSVIVQRGVDIYANIDKNFQLETEIRVHTSNAWKRFVFLFSVLGKSFGNAAHRFFTSKLMRHINNHNEFLEALYKTTYKIGMLSMAKIIFNLILSFVFTFWYGAIELRAVPSSPYNKSVSVQFNPALDFDLYYFLFALVLIILASLFKYGYELEQDKQMTI